MRYYENECALTHRVLYFGDKQSEVIVVVLVCNIIYQANSARSVGRVPFL